MIRDFGIYTALGTFISLMLSLFFIPALLSAFSWSNKTDSEKSTGEWISVADENVFIGCS